MFQAFCRWYNVPMKDLAEHEQEQCEENGQQCEGCPDLVMQHVKDEQKLSE